MPISALSALAAACSRRLLTMLHSPFKVVEQESPISVYGAIGVLIVPVLTLPLTRQFGVIGMDDPLAPADIGGLGKLDILNVTVDTLPIGQPLKVIDGIYDRLAPEVEHATHFLVGATMGE